jgi:hypothetical protein
MSSIDPPITIGAQPAHRGGVGTAAAYGVVLWAAVTAAFLAAGSAIFPSSHSVALLPVLVGLLVVTGAAMWVVALDYARRAHAEGTHRGLVFGAAVAIVGLVLDAIYLIAFSFKAPGLTVHETQSMIAYLLLAYPLTIVVPAAALSRRARG